MTEREDKFKLHRMILIDKWIRSGAYPSIQQMMDEYGVSRRTVLRDMEFLRDRYNAPLECDRVRGGYYYSDPTFMIQNVLLTEGDLFTVSTLMPLMEQYKNTPLESSFKNIMAKIAEMLPDKVTVDTSFLNDDVTFIPDPLPKIEEEVFNGIFKAVKLRETISFGYKSVGSDEFKQKAFDSYRVLCQKGNWYVLGYEHGAADTRTFALSRMSGINFTGEHFEVPKDFDIAQHVDLSFGIWNNREEPTEYELLFTKNMANYILERTWHKEQTVERTESGDILLKFKTNQRQQVFSWVLGFGDAVTVLKPEALREELRREGEKLSRKYEK